MRNDKLRYSILKEVNQGNKYLTEELFSLDEKTFDDNVNFLIREGYLKGVEHADDRPQFNSVAPYITEQGEKYLEENSTWSKSYEKLKELRDWIK